MKYIILIIGLLIVGCGEFTESTPTTTEKPVKELTLAEKVVGEYEMKEGREGKDTVKLVLLGTGIIEVYENGKKEDETEGKWKVVNGEIHVEVEDGIIGVFRINKDGSLTGIASIDKDGKREDTPKEDQGTIKKIK